MRSDLRIKALHELDALRIMHSFYDEPKGYWRIGLARHVNRARRACEKAGVGVDLRIKLMQVIIGDTQIIGEIERCLTQIT